MFSKARNSYSQATQNLSKASAKVFINPVYVAMAIVTSVLSIGLALWLANFGLMQVVLSSGKIDLWSKFTFMFEIYQVIFRVSPWLNIAFLLVYGLLSGFALCLWLYVFMRQHDGDKAYEHAGWALVVGVFGGSLNILGASLIMPIMTRDGAVLDVDGYVFGSLALMAGLIITLNAVRQLASIIASDN